MVIFENHDRTSTMIVPLPLECCIKKHTKWKPQVLFGVTPLQGHATATYQGQFRNPTGLVIYHVVMSALYTERMFSVRTMDSSKNHSELSADWTLDLTRVAGGLFLTDDMRVSHQNDGFYDTNSLTAQGNLLGHRTEVSFPLEVSEYLRRC